MIFSIRMTLDSYILKITPAKLKSKTKEVVVRFLNIPHHTGVSKLIFINLKKVHIKFLAFICKVLNYGTLHRVQSKLRAAARYPREAKKKSPEIANFLPEWFL